MNNRQNVISRPSTVSVRNLVFGVEDGLVSTVGFVSGIASAGMTYKTILLSGAVLVVVEAFSMAVGSFLSEASAEEFEHARAMSTKKAVGGSVVMFISYIVAGLIILAPYFIFEPHQALWYSIGLSLIALFILGMVSSRLSGISSFRQPIRMVLVGGVAALLGVLIAQFVNGISQ